MFKNKYISLVLLWALGLVMVIYLAIPLIRNGGDESVANSNLQSVSNPDGSKYMVSQAYVFVTIDKKHFLTRFPSYRPAEVTTPMITVTTGRKVERIFTRIKTIKQPKKVEDFTIKPAPLE